MRDDFTVKTKEIMAKRVGYRCSNPNCRCLTVGPQQNKEKTLTIGVAAHIKAAAPGGPRYDEYQTPVERISIENGIWLCGSHAKLIDNDELRYTVDILNQWKELSERAALLEIEEKDNKVLKSDIEIIKNFAVAFDRPAFKDPIIIEGSMESFDRAIDDTIIALTTGKLVSRNNIQLNTSSGKSFINDDKLRNQMDVITNMLRALRDRYRLAKINGEIHVGNEYEGRQFFVFNNRELIPWFDETRKEILTIFKDACDRIGFKWEASFGMTRRYW